MKHERVIDLDGPSPDDEAPKTHYVMEVVCMNCDYEGEASIAMGVKVDSANCPECGCDSIEKQSARKSAAMDTEMAGYEGEPARAANEIELRFDYEPGRLMTSDEEVEFERLGDDIIRRREPGPIGQRGPVGPPGPPGFPEPHPMVPSPEWQRRFMEAQDMQGRDENGMLNHIDNASRTVQSMIANSGQPNRNGDVFTPEAIGAAMRDAQNNMLIPSSDEYAEAVAHVNPPMESMAVANATPPAPGRAAPADLFGAVGVQRLS